MLESSQQGKVAEPDFGDTDYNAIEEVLYGSSEG